MLDIKFFQLINIFLLHYTVAGAVVIHTLKQNSDTKYLLIAVVLTLTHLTTVNKNRLNVSVVLEINYLSQNPVPDGKPNKKLLPQNTLNITFPDAYTENKHFVCNQNIQQFCCVKRCFPKISNFKNFKLNY